MRLKIISLLLLLSIVLLVFSCKQTPENKEYSYPEYKELHYKMLDSALAGRKQQLVSYLTGVQQRADKIHTDEFTLKFFKTIHAFQEVKSKKNFPEKLVKETKALKQQFKEHYIVDYHVFYDMLFIDSSGEIFYTIRQQGDYKKNIFKGELKTTALSEKMKTRPSTSFVDFQFYEISGEPSAFFIEPVKDEKGQLGWVVLQFSIDKINNMFCLHQDIGETHEVILVNKDHYMLTDSRFIAKSTILSEQLAKENIDAKFKEGKGQKAVVDYRGHKVFSSFEVFDLLGSQWLIISKMDEEELITSYFLQYPDKMTGMLNQIIAQKKSAHKKGRLNIEHGIEVDMDEFRRNDDSQLVYTHGVSSCTAFIIKKPGDFSYFAHISPYDKVYGEDRTDLLTHILKKIEYLEVTDSEKHALNFYLVSSSKDAFEEMLKRLMKEGYFLSQVKILYHPQAVHANVSSRSDEAGVLVSWKMNEQLFYLENSREQENLQKQVQELLGE